MKKTLLYFVVLLTAFSLVTPATFARNENANRGNLQNEEIEEVKEDKGEKWNKVATTAKSIKDFEKPNGKSNAQAHKEKVQGVVKELKTIAKEKKEEASTMGMEAEEVEETEEMDEGAEEEVEESEELEELAEEIEQSEKETVEAIEKAEGENKFKKLLMGTDYRNLGQLRSGLVKNRNQIRQLTRVAEKTEDEEVKTATQEQLTVLMQERARIKTVLQENESGFSFLGWLFRFLNGYPSESINETEEEALEEEVEEALEEETTEEETTEEDDSVTSTTN